MSWGCSLSLSASMGRDIEPRASNVFGAPGAIQLQTHESLHEEDRQASFRGHGVGDTAAEQTFPSGCVM
jgi:hypothetical protein